MYRFIQRRKKWILAIFGTVLMIAFILPFGVGNFGQPDASSLPYGKMGDETVTRQEVARAGQDLDALFRAGFMPLVQLGEPPQPFFGGNPQGRVAGMLREKPETYALLQKEARAAGIAPGVDEVNGLYTQYFAGRPGMIRSADDAEAYRGAVERFLLVRDSFQRVTADLKVTAPLVRATVAQGQQATLNLVEFTADEFLAQAPEPSAEQVQAHYDRYANVAPPPPSLSMPSTQPVQFGYKRPDRVKLQYLELPQDRVVEAVLKGFAPNELLPLDRVGYVYYDANPQEFQTPAAAATTPATNPATNPTTNPATGPAATQPTTGATTGPATNPATSPATAPAAAAGPTTRPFDAATKTELRRKLLTGAIQPPAAAPAEDLAAVRAMSAKLDTQAEALRTKLRDRLLADFQAFRAATDGGSAAGNPAAPASAAGPSTQPSGPAATNPSAAAGPATAPATRPAVAVDKLEYLETVANEFEQAHGVRPMVTSLANEWLTRDALARLGGIGTSYSIQGTFIELATKHAVEIEPEGPAAPSPSAAPATSPSATPGTQPTTAGAAATGPATQPTTQPATTQPTTTTTTAAATPSPAVQPTKAAKPAMALYEPSPLLRDEATKNAYVFRLTAFEGEQVPPLEQVREQIVKDLKLTAAYAEARKLAETFRAAAGSSANNPVGGFPTQAEPMKKNVIVAGPLNPRTMEVPGYDLSGDMTAQQTFLMSIDGLLRRATADQPHPSAVVELPAQKKVLVAELRSLERPWAAAEDAANMAAALDSARIRLYRDRAIDMALLNWFDFETVAKRTNFSKSDRG